MLLCTPSIHTFYSLKKKKRGRKGRFSNLVSLPEGTGRDTSFPLENLVSWPNLSLKRKGTKEFSNLSQSPGGFPLEKWKPVVPSKKEPAFFVSNTIFVRKSGNLLSWPNLSLKRKGTKEFSNLSQSP